MFSDFLINIIASVAFAVIGFFASRMKDWYIQRDVRAIWKRITRGKSVTIVLSTRPGPYPRSTPRVSFYEMKAFAEINKTLSSLGAEVIPISSETPLPQVKNTNVIILGSPVANKIAEQVWNDITGELPFKYNVQEQYITVGDREYRPTLDNEGVLTKDYGLIIFRGNPYDEDKGLVISAGCHGFATYGAVSMLVNRHMIRKLRRATHNQNFAALVEIEKKGELITSSRVLECYVIAKP